MATGTVQLELVSEPAGAGRDIVRMSSKKLLARAYATRVSYQTNGVQERCHGCTLLGFRGLVCLALSVAIGGLLAYAYTVFNSRPLYILVIAILAFCIPLKFAFYLALSSRAAADDGKQTPDTKVKHKCWQLLSSVMEKFDELVDPDGKYYIIKTYASELGEYSAQLFAINVYACSFPVWITTIFYASLALEAVAITIDTFWTMKHGLTVRRRNNRVMADIVLEVVSAMTPLLIMWFGYVISFTELEFVQIALVPAMFAMQKILEITEAILRERAIEYHYLKKKTKRLSFFAPWAEAVKLTKEETDENEILAQVQMQSTPRWAHIGFGLLTLVYALFLSSLVVGQLMLQPSIQCGIDAMNTKVWDSCTVKVPFCKHVFSPTCNCVYLSVEKHNWTALPDIIKSMDAMKIMGIKHGPLETLPELPKLKKLTRIDLSFNRLSTVPASFGSLQHLTVLDIRNNCLNLLPATVWGHPNLVYLELANNNISTVAVTIETAKNLRYLFLGNNSVSIFPSSIIRVRTLKIIYLDGNKIAKIPANIGDLESLEVLYLHNNRFISAVPNSLGRLSRLDTLDIRNNSIFSLPNDVMALKSLKWLYLENNPLCSGEWIKKANNAAFVESFDQYDAGCSKQCSPYCPSYLQRQQTCMNECNSASCDYNNGKCLRNGEGGG